MENKKYICPICGYNDLVEAPYNELGIASFDICPCCGYEFGSCEYFCNSNYPVDVGYKFDYKENKDFYKYVRGLWIKQGAKWFRKEKKPKNWDILNQLANINLPKLELDEYTSEKRDFENRVIKFFVDKIPQIEVFVKDTYSIYTPFEEAGMYIVLPDIIRYFQKIVEDKKLFEVQTFLSVYWDFYKTFEKEYHTLVRSDTMQNLTRVELFEIIDCFDEKTKEKVVKLLPEELKKDYLFCCNN